MPIIENAFCTCREVKRSDIEKYFSPLSDESVELICMDADDQTYNRHVFGIVRINDNGNKYIDIYFINRLIYYPQSYKRFVIMKDYRLSEEDEDEFVFLCRQTRLDIQVDNFIKLQNSFSEDFCPDMPIEVYTANNIGNYLLHIYYTTHHSGAREILYKAGFSSLAEKLDGIEDYNPAGNSPEEILGIPLKLIRIFENNGMTDRLLSETKRKQANIIYRKYSSYFDIKQGIMPGEFQWRYLEEYNRIGNGTFKKGLYKNLADVNEVIYNKYIRFEELINNLRDTNLKISSKIPAVKELSGIVSELEMINIYYEYRQNWDAKIQKSNKLQYDYSDDKYMIIQPGCLVDIINEAIMQNNCLLECGYINKVACGKARLLFIRQKSNPDKSFVTVEMRGRRIVQVKGTSNSIPNRDVLHFLERFSESCGVKFEPQKHINEQ